jgi:rubrerythrin
LWFTRRWRWRTPSSTARLLRRFAAAEQSSFYDMLYAANHTADVVRRAQYLRHAHDEARHARLFLHRARELDGNLSLRGNVRASDSVDFEHLYEELGEAQFLSFVHHGERRGRRQMTRFIEELASLEATESSHADRTTRLIFEAVIRDEHRHEKYTSDAASSTGGSHARAVLWEAGRRWRRVGSGPAGVLFAVFSSVLFAMVALPLSLFARVTKSH